MNIPKKHYFLFAFAFMLSLAFFLPSCGAGEKKKSKPAYLPNWAAYPPEHIYDTRSYPDEALSNLRIESSRWPDCHTFETAIQSIFRIEGVTDKDDEQKALALWKWMRILMSATGYGYAFEGSGPGEDRIVFDGHKILTVYGHHQCDGLSFAMVPLWRAAGYMAFDEASHGHTTASLRYQDHDGKERYHSFDLKKGFFWWNLEQKIVGNRTLPLMQGTVFRHLTLPQKVHSLRTSLHLNERLERKWKNTGQVIPYGRHPGRIEFSKYYKHDIGRTKGVYSSAGMEIQQFSPDLSPGRFQKDVYRLSGKFKSSPLDDGGCLLHPERADAPVEVVYRIHSPYAGVNGSLEMGFRTGSVDSRFRLYLSRDEKKWDLVFNAEEPGDHHVKIDLGRKKRDLRRPNIYTAYTFFLKVEMTSSHTPLDTGLKDLSLMVYRCLNKRTLPNLMPGRNVFRVSADALEPGYALDLTIDYKVKSQGFSARHLIESFPYYFTIVIKDAEPEIRSSYDKVFGMGDIQMDGFSMKLVDIEKQRPSPFSGLDKKTGETLFQVAYPHPAGSRLVKKRKMKLPVKKGPLADGFFPQYYDRPVQDKETVAHISRLERLLGSGKDSKSTTWRAAEKLGYYPEALGALLEELPGANIDLTLFICKALARIRAPESIPILLEKWEQAPQGAPGTRYIPDVLAAIGDPKVVPFLVDKLEDVRFDFRFHIARALGKLGGEQAENALMDLAVKDPFPAVRKIAQDALSDLRGKPKP